jgi:hypothetical protein
LNKAKIPFSELPKAEAKQWAEKKLENEVSKRVRNRHQNNLEQNAQDIRGAENRLRY